MSWRIKAVFAEGKVNCRTSISDKHADARLLTDVKTNKRVLKRPALSGKRKEIY